MIGAGRIDAVVLLVADADVSLDFYRERLGMVLVDQDHVGGVDRHRLAFASGAGLPPTAMELWHEADRPRAPYRHHPDDVFWKIGITLADVDLARRELRAAGVTVSEAAQFEDIGYLCHLSDPDGYVIELLQHRFENDFEPVTPEPSLALGTPATLGQITLRVADADAALAFYRDQYAMRLLSRQRVASVGFTLYFLAATDESPPADDLDAVANRPWLWQRRYTQIELQHWDPGRAPTHGYRRRPEDDLGFVGLRIDGTLVSPPTH